MVWESGGEYQPRDLAAAEGGQKEEGGAMEEGRGGEEGRS